MGLTMMSKATKADREAAIAALLNPSAWGIQPGQTIYTFTKHCAASGMSRVIRVLFVRRDDIPDTCGQLVGVGSVPGLDPYDRAFGADDRHIGDVSWVACKAIQGKWSQAHSGIVVGGCGFNAGLHVVDALAYALQMPLRHTCI